MPQKKPRGQGKRGLNAEALTDEQRVNQDSEPRWASLSSINGISETLDIPQDAKTCVVY